MSTSTLRVLLCSILVSAWTLSNLDATFALREEPDQCLQGKAEGTKRDRPGPPDTSSAGETVEVRQVCVCSAWIDSEFRTKGTICNKAATIYDELFSYSAYRPPSFPELPAPWGSACVPWVTSRSQSWVAEVQQKTYTCSSYPTETEICRPTTEERTENFRIINAPPTEEAPYFTVSTCMESVNLSQSGYDPVYCENRPDRVSGYRSVTRNQTEPGDCPVSQ